MTSGEEAEKKKQIVLELERQEKEKREAEANAEADAGETADDVPLEDLAAPAPSPSPSPSDSDPSDDDSEGGFIAPEGDEDSDDYAKEKVVKGGAAKKKKKVAKVRRSLKTSLVLDPLQLASINRAMIGQRGSPPEEELINWAHHITGMSAPDPLFRQALGSMNKTKDGQGYVSFIFSCEVKESRSAPP